MLKRTIERLVRNRLKIYPAVALIGPRQCGKTTLAQSMKGAYFDLEQKRSVYALISNGEISYQERSS